MKGKPILFIHTHKAITQVPIVLPGLFKHGFFEQPKFEVEARLALVIFLGDRIHRRDERDGPDGLGQSDCAEYA
jgi:hypothetical protein